MRSDSVLWQKPLHPQNKSQKATWQHKNATKNFDYTTDSVLWQKPLHPQNKSQKATWQHKNATKNFDYTTIGLQVTNKMWGDLDIEFDKGSIINLFCKQIVFT